MKEVILIEDRPGRQVQFLGSEQVLDLKSISGLTIPEKRECIENFRSLNNEIVPERFNTANLLILHRSSIDAYGLKTINTFCRKKKISLILFSGGLSQYSYQEEGYPCLSLNSKDLYSYLLVDFLRKYTKGEIENLLQLIYGDSWKLSYLLQYRQLKIIYENESDPEVQIILEDKMDKIQNTMGIDLKVIDHEINSLILNR